MQAKRVDLLVDRNDLRSIIWREAAPIALQPGQARLRLDRFALTANNITYAVLGDKSRYWDFFPAPEGYGRLPVWGFADVEESRVDGLFPGERIFGYFPISTELVLSVGDLTQSGFSDTSPWRSQLSAVYNRYLRVTDDPTFSGTASEALQGVFRPLFSTSFLIDDFLTESAFFGAKSVLVSSASSKTSLALGYLLKRSGGRAIETVGLTSPHNSAFVRDTGYFDNVLDYAEIDRLRIAPAIYIDMAGSAKLRSVVHNHFKGMLQYSCAVGISHWEEAGGASNLPGPRPAVFFAPGHVDKKTAIWGVDGYEGRLRDAWPPFCESVSGWLEVSGHKGPEAIEALYRSVLEGKCSPRLATMGDMSS